MDNNVPIDLDDFVDEESKEKILERLNEQYGKEEDEVEDDLIDEAEEKDNIDSSELELDASDNEEEEIYETSNRHKKKRETQNERLKRLNNQLKEENERLRNRTFEENQMLFEQKKQAEIEMLEQQSELLRLKREQYQLIAEEAQSTNNPVSVRAIAELSKADRELERIEENLERKRSDSYSRAPHSSGNENLPDDFVQAQENFIKKHKYLQNDPDAQEIATQIANKLNRKYNISGEDDLIGSPKYMQELDRLLSKKIAEDLEINLTGKKNAKRGYVAPVKSSKSSLGSQPILSNADKKYLQSIVNIVGEDQAEIIKKSFLAAKKRQLQERNEQ